jgi:aryl-alcohol dehydrogenase-like predicted oxidoreductase
MRYVQLPNGKRTSRIGFGCGRLVGSASLRHSLSLVEEARRLGITHFDVAPSYGLGTAEDVLGQAVGGDSDVTIATKVGISRPPNSQVLSFARSLLRPAFQGFSGFRRLVNTGLTMTGGRDKFSASQITASFSASLERLRRDRVDILLLHEPSTAALTVSLEETLGCLVDQSRVDLLGSSTGADSKSVIPFGEVSQYAFTINDGRAKNATFNILHGVMRRYLRVHDNGSGSANSVTRAPVNGRAGLLLTYALGRNPGSIVLVSTSDKLRLKQTIEAIDWEAAEDNPELLANVTGLDEFMDLSGRIR